MKTMNSPEVAQLAVDLRLAIGRIARRVKVEGTSAVPPHHYSVLARLDNGPRTASDLAASERVSAPSMTRTTSALVERGWVRRETDPADRRCAILTLTPQGRRVLRDGRRERNEWMGARLARLSPEELETLAAAERILRRVAAE